MPCQNFEIAVGLLVLGAKGILERRFGLELLADRTQVNQSAKKPFCDSLVEDSILCRVLQANRR